MPYLIFTAQDHEIDRRELKGTVTIGRTSECDICIRDIMMSRAHCRLERQGETWVLTDLNSRNGTFLGHERVEQHLLREGDALRMGRTRMLFCTGRFEPAKKSDKPARVRPVDPNESFSGTVVGFELLDPGEAEYDENMPIPQPRPLEPAALVHDDVHGLLNDIASSARSSIGDKTLRMQKSARQAHMSAKSSVRSKSRVSFALQAHHRAGTDETTRKQDLNGKLSRDQRRVAAAVLTFAVALVVSAAWLAVESSSPRNSVAGVVAKAPAPAPVVAPAEVAAHVELMAPEPDELIEHEEPELERVVDDTETHEIPDPSIVARVLLHTYFGM